jgi:hypothetical protein
MFKIPQKILWSGLRAPQKERRRQINREGRKTQNRLRVVGAIVEATLVTKLWNTSAVVTLLTNSASGKKSVASLKADTSGNINFGAADLKETYGRLVPEVVFANTADFRSYYEYRKVK